MISEKVFTSIEESYHFKKRKVLNNLQKLYDMGYDNSLICEILKLDVRIFKRFIDGTKIHKNNLKKIEDGLGAILILENQYEQKS